MKSLSKKETFLQSKWHGLGTFIISLILIQVFFVYAKAAQCTEVFTHAESGKQIPSSLGARAKLLQRMRGEIDQIQNPGKQKQVTPIEESTTTNKKVRETQKTESTTTKEVKEDRTKDEETSKTKRRQRPAVSVIDGTVAVFHTIEPGSFKMGKPGKQVNVTITKPFDFMATSVTQLVYRQIADLLNQKVRHMRRLDPDPSKTNIAGKRAPVTNVTYRDVSLWIDGLNYLSTEGEPALNKIIPGHKQGDIYRLPTEAEYEFVLRSRGQITEDYPFGSDLSKLDDFAWYDKNSEMSHAVATKQPIVIDGNKFYDLIGNTENFTSDWFQQDLPGGIDPQGPTQGEGKVIRGSSFRSNASEMELHRQLFIQVYEEDAGLGFRLARTLTADEIRTQKKENF